MGYVPVDGGTGILPATVAAGLNCGLACSVILKRVPAGRVGILSFSLWARVKLLVVPATIGYVLAVAVGGLVAVLYTVAVTFPITGGVRAGLVSVIVKLKRVERSAMSRSGAGRYLEM